MATFNSKVLIVDDEFEIAESLKHTLANAGASESLGNSSKALFGVESEAEISFFVEVALSGSRAVEMVKTSLDNQSPFAVIFLDIRMPQEDGVRTAFKIRELDPFVEIVFMSAFSDYTEEQLNKILGQSFPFLVKPFKGVEAIETAKESLKKWNKKVYGS